MDAIQAEAAEPKRSRAFAATLNKEERNVIADKSGFGAHRGCAENSEAEQLVVRLALPSFSQSHSRVQAQSIPTRKSDMPFWLRWTAVVF